MLARVLALSAICSVGFAQMSFRGVVSGYVLDARSNTVRPVLGIPGAAYLGSALPLPWGVTAAAIRGSRDVAVVISDEQPRRVYVLSGLSGTVAAARLDAAMPDSDRVFLSADGSTAAIVSTSQGQVQIAANLATAPAVSGPVPLGLRGSIAAVAISNSGCALAAGADDRSGQVVELCAAKPGLVVLVFDRDGFRPTALTWLDNRKAAVADAASNQVLLFANMDGGAPGVLLDHSSGIDSPVGLVAIDSSTVAVANAGAAALVVSSIDGSSPARTVSLPLAPSKLEPLDTPSILVSNALLDFPLLLVDAHRDYGVFFVPSN